VKSNFYSVQRCSIHNTVTFIAHRVAIMGDLYNKENLRYRVKK